jgi:hypothetical protein
MSMFISFPGVTPPSTRGRVGAADPIEPAAGALYLYEFANPVNPIAAGVPAHNSQIPNLLAAQSLATVGGGVPADVAGTFLKGEVAPRNLAERSGKGGVAFIASQTVAPAASDGIAVAIPVKILNYLAANPEHDVFASVWARLTRQGNDTGSWLAVGFNTAGATNGTNLLFSVAQDGQHYPNTSDRIGMRRIPTGGWRPAQAAVAPGTALLGNVAVTRNSGAVTANRNGKAMSIHRGDPFPGNTTAADQISGILYRAYMEDLTVSGRTYAQVDAIDFEQFTKHALTAGGRYYGDTYTNPTSVA